MIPAIAGVSLNTSAARLVLHTKYTLSAHI